MPSERVMLFRNGQALRVFEVDADYEPAPDDTPYVREDVAAKRLAEVEAARDDAFARADGFAARCLTVDVELIAMRAERDRLREGGGVPTVDELAAVIGSVGDDEMLNDYEAAEAIHVLLLSRLPLAPEEGSTHAG